MIRPPSNQNHYDMFWSGDPAFVQLDDNPTDAQKEEHTRKWRIARETGNYGGLLIEGMQPTRFVVRPLPGDCNRKLIDRMFAGRIGGLELNALVFRAALVDVVGFGDFKVKMVESEFGPIASHEITNALDESARGCVNELGIEILNRAAGVSGK